jgi:uncharacterized cupredoxin-like copper-binding protein
MKGFIAVILGVVILIVLYQKESENEKRDIKQNSFYGTVISVSLRLEDGQIMIKNGSNHAISNGVLGWMFFGPVGGVIGAVAGAGESTIQTENIPAKIGEMVVSVKNNSTGLCHYFTVIEKEKRLFSDTEKGRGLDMRASKFTLAISLQPGEKIRILSRQPLSRMACVYAHYFFLEGEKTPIDE